MREQTRCHKTFKYKLQPTPRQAEALAETLRLCRQLYNCALEQRRTWWGRGQGRAATHAQQEAELPDLKAAFPEYAAIHLKCGAETPGFSHGEEASLPLPVSTCR